MRPREALCGQRMVSGPGYLPGCFLARRGALKGCEDLPMTFCSGRLTKAHLISQQTLKREQTYRHGCFDIWDPALWVWACWDHHSALDKSRTLYIPREHLPQATIDFAEEFGLTWYLDREYGRTLYG